VTDQISLQTPGPILEIRKDTFGKRLKEFPWWFIAIILIAIWAGFIIFSNDYLFSSNLELVESLDTGKLNDQITQEFKTHEINLTPATVINVQRPGEKWKITDGLNAYYLKKEDLSISVLTRGNYGQAFDFIKIGISVTIKTSLIAYGIAVVFGLMAGLGRISNNLILNNLSRLYVELIRGIPMLVLIFFIALVGVPLVVDGLNTFGQWLFERGMEGVGNALTIMNNQAVAMNGRAIIALAVTYGAFLAEIFRAGIQSIGKGQMEAARSLGMSYAQAMRYIILPQAIRNVLPALGNDFVAMVKDSSLVSVLAVRDITQVARLYAGSTFRFREAYVTLSVMYLTMTVLLSLLVQLLERRLRAND
jgi:polar amino acid transport system permease protein